MKNDQFEYSDIYRSMMKESPVGCSYNELIRDEEGNPVDYEFLEINQAFEELVGQSRSEIIGRMGSEVFPGSKRGKSNWIEEYGKIAKTGESREFERFSEQLDRWFRIKVYSPKGDHFLTYFTDVTQEMELANASEDILQQPLGEIDYQALTDRAREISGAKHVAFNLFAEKGSRFTTKAVSGPSEDIRQAASKLGLDLVGKTWDPDPDRWDKMKGQSIVHFDSITELSKGLLPVSIIKSLERAFSIGETVLTRIKKDDQIIGDFTLFMPQGKDLEKERLIEIYTKQVGSLIVRNRAKKKQLESERELEKSKEKYQSYFEELGDAVYITKVGGEDHGRILDVNSAAVEQTGYSEEELIGLNIENDIAVEEPETIAYEEGDEKLARGETVNFVEKKKRKDGTEYWTEVIVTRIKHEGEIAALSINREVTERKKAQRELEERVELQRLLVELSGRFLEHPETNLDEIIDDVLAEIGEFLGVDRTYLFQFDWEHEEMSNTHEWCGKGVEPQIDNLQDIPNSSLPAWMDKLQGLENIHIPSVPDLPDSWEAERKILEAQNIQSLVVVPVFYARNLLGFAGFDAVHEKREWTKEEIDLLRIFGDLTGSALHLHDTEEKLRRSEQKFRSYVENAPLGVYVVNEKGQFLEVNKAAGEMTGYSQEELRTMGLSDLVPPGVAGEAQQAFERVAGQGEVQVESPYSKKDGTRGHMVVNAVKLSEDRYLGFTLDITERKEAERELEKVTLETLQALNRTIEAKDEYTGEHIDRVQELSLEIGKHLGLSEERLEQLKYASILHDIGKIGISDTILGKEGQLTEDEWEEMERHPEIGKRIVGQVDQLNGAAKIIGQHQEKYDGSGYPNGLEGEEITLEARIVAVADAWDAMRSDRPYRESLAREEALRELRENAGSHFDPEIVDILVEEIAEDETRFGEN